MSAYQPPTEDLPIFDTNNFAVSLNTPLTLGQGLKYFLSYPNAQGTENFNDINVNGIGNFPTNLQTSFISAITGGGNFYLDGDIAGGDIVLSTKNYANKTIIENLNSVCATFENGVITGYLNGTSNSTYSLISPSLTPNGSILYSDGTYSQYISNAGSLVGQALLSGGSGITPYWGSPTYTYNIIGGSANKIVYQTGVDTTSFLPTGTAGQTLISGGSGGSPSWGNNLGLITTFTSKTATYTTTATDFNILLYFTGAVTKNLILSTPSSTIPVATPDGSSIIVINRGTSTGTLLVYTTNTTGTNLITTLAISTNAATTGGQFVYSATTGWIALFGNS